MKKFLSLVLCAFAIFAFCAAGCGKTADNNEKGNVNDWAKLSLDVQAESDLSYIKTSYGIYKTPKITSETQYSEADDKQADKIATCKNALTSVGNADSLEKSNEDLYAEAKRNGYLLVVIKKVNTRIENCQPNIEVCFISQDGKKYKLSYSSEDNPTEEALAGGTEAYTALKKLAK